MQELKSQNVKVGGVAVIKHEQKRFVYYLVTKQDPYKKPTYDDLKSSLTAMKKHMVNHSPKSFIFYYRLTKKKKFDCRLPIVYQSWPFHKLAVASIDSIGLKSNKCCTIFSTMMANQASKLLSTAFKDEWRKRNQLHLPQNTQKSQAKDVKNFAIQIS